MVIKMNKQLLVGLKQIADYLNRSPQTITTYIKKYQLPAYKIGGLFEASVYELDQWKKLNKTMQVQKC